MRVLISETTWATSAVAHDLSNEGFLVSRANDGEETLLYIRDAVQDAVILDADLGDIGTARAIRTLRVLRPALPVLVIADAADREVRRELFAAGADHVATEIPEPKELAARVRATARRAARFTSPVIQIGDVTFNLDARRVQVGGIPVALTPSEYEIVEHLILRQRQIVSRDEIMTHLYGLEEGPDPRILDVHSTRIRKKLAAAGANPKHLRAINARGFIFDAVSEVATAA